MKEHIINNIIIETKIQNKGRAILDILLKKKVKFNFASAVVNGDYFDDASDNVISLNTAEKKIRFLELSINRRIDLTEYCQNVSYIINGASRNVKDFVINNRSLEWMYGHVKDNALFIFDTDPDVLVQKCLDWRIEQLFGESRYTPDGAVDKWLTPKQLESTGFYGDCEDYSIFMINFILIQLYENGFKELDDRINFVIVPMSDKHGFGSGVHHATLLWEAMKDNKFYIIGSNTTSDGTLVARSRQLLYRKDINHRIEYGKPVLMINAKKSYRNPMLSR